MAQHFLLSAAARTLSLRAIYKAGEEVAYDTFCKMRWPETDGEAVCPQCGCCETYKITTQSWADTHAKLAQDAHNTARATDLLGYQMEQASLQRGQK